MLMNKLKIVDMNGQQTIDSRLVAEALEMQHKDLLEKIRNYEQILIGGKFRSLDFFISSTYKDSRNREKPCYMLTKKGCEMVANKTTGEKGVIFTAMYVEAFNQMEKQPKIPTDPRELLKLTIMAQEDTAKRVDVIEGKVKELDENKLLNPGEYHLINTRVRERINHIIKAYHLDPNKKQRSELYKSLNREIKVITGIECRSQLMAKDFKKVLDFVNTWEPSKATLIVVEQLSLKLEEEE